MQILHFDWRVLKQATVDNFPVGVRWISGLIWSALFQVEKLNILSKSRYNVDLILVMYLKSLKSNLRCIGSCLKYLVSHFDWLRY